MNTRQQEYVKERADALRDRCEKALRHGATSTEVADIGREVEDFKNLVEEWKGTDRIAESIASLRAPANRAAERDGRAGPGAGGLAGAVRGAGFNLKSRPSVEVRGFSVLGQKAPTITDPEQVSVASPAAAALGRDRRFLWPNLNRLDAGTDTAVSDFRQTSRAVTGSVERDLTATTDKAELAVDIEHVVEAMKQAAVVMGGIPNAVLEADRSFTDLFNGELRHQVDQAVDAHCVANILAATPPAGDTGTGLVAQTRNAVSAMRGEGANPTLLVVSPSDAADLDLFEDTGGSLIFPTRDSGSSSPLWGLQVVERAGHGDPLLIDSQLLGVLYLGSVRIDADPFTGFKNNTTALRAEASVLCHVRNAAGARRVGTA